MPLAPGLYANIKNSDNKPVVAASTSVTAIIGVYPNLKDKSLYNVPTHITSWQDFETKYGELPALTGEPFFFLPYSVHQYYVEGGSDCYILAVEKDFTELDKILPKFDKLSIDLMIIPDIKGDKDSHTKVSAYCEKREDVFFIGDIPNMKGREKTPYSELRKLYPTSKNSSIYGPWILCKYGTTSAYFPASAAVAGIFARTDSDRGVHKAPAGLNGKLRTSLGVEEEFSKGDVGTLNDDSINCIWKNTTNSTCVWGTRTLADSKNDVEWRYVPVRRLLIFIKKSIEQSMQWAVFEPNSPVLWGSLKRNIYAFLLKLWKDGALSGDTPDEAFVIKVDKENNPPSERTQGKLYVDIGVAPVRPAEFIFVRISQKQENA